MADELKDQRIPIMMSPSEVKAIDDWMFANRLKSRGQAIRTLVRFGLRKDVYEEIIEASRMMIRALQGQEDFSKAKNYYIEAHQKLIGLHEEEIEATWTDAERNVLNHITKDAKYYKELTDEQRVVLAKEIVRVTREFDENNKK